MRRKDNFKNFSAHGDWIMKTTPLRIILSSSQPMNSFWRLGCARAIRGTGREASSLTWCGQPVLILGGMVRDSLQHHPHCEGEHGREEAIEDKVEEEDKS